jgi:hypothetical protein
MRKTLLLVSLIAVSEARAQVVLSGAPTTNVKPTLTAPMRQQIDQTLLADHSLAIQTYLARQSQARVELKTSRSNDSMRRQAAIIERSAIRSVGYRVTLDPNTGELSVEPAPAGMPGSTTSTSSLTSKATTSESTTTPAPAIASIDRTDIMPVTDLVTIYGAHFGDPGAITPQEVHFILPGGSNVSGTISYWSDSGIVAMIPDVSGIGAGNASLYVQAGARGTAPQSFHFVPLSDTRVMQPVDGTYSIGRGCADDLWSSAPNFKVFHDGFEAAGCKGDDEYFSNQHLNNGWTVDSVIVSARPFKNSLTYFGVTSETDANATKVVSYEGTNNLYAKVHWFVNGCAAFCDLSVDYTISFGIKGPKGTNP